MEKVLAKILLASLTASCISSCASQSKASKTDTASSTIQDGNTYTDDNFLILSDNQLATVGKANAFALDMFRTQIDNESKVISPVSVSFLMGMLANGASGNTQKEILKTLLGKDGDKMSLTSVNEAYKALTNIAKTSDKNVTMNIANLIATNKQVDVNTAYKKTISSMYGADIEKLDFASSMSVRHINDWCSQKTDKMIPEIIDQLSPSDMAVLVNAIFFNATWKDQFDKRNTKTENFKGYTRDIKRVPMMHNNAKFRYADNTQFAAVELPYGHGNYSMTILLPNNGTSISEMMKALTPKDLEETKRAMTTCIVDLKMPRFTTTTDVQLNNIIAKLGAPSIFKPSTANFKNMSDNNFHVSAMIQKAKIEVSEEGTKAAAVTAAIMTMSALGPEEPRRVNFHADRPFVYIITENTTGAIFFIGQYTGSEQ